MKYELQKNYDLLIKAPCNISVIKGSLSIQGIELNEKETISLIDQNTFTITSLSDSIIDIDCEILNKYETLNWHKIAYDISATRGIVVVLGETDSGKTYFTNLLSNKLPNDTRVIDADVGQSSLFIPTFIASTSVVKPTLSLREKGYEELEFFGDITPSSNPRLHTNLILRLVETGKEKLKIIDTDGWVRGFLAYRHKIELLELLDPDHIILMSENLRNNLPSKFKERTIILKKPPYLPKRTPEVRRLRRSLLYKEYFKNSKDITVDYEEILGTRISDNLIISWGDAIGIDDDNCQEHYNIRNLVGALLGLVKRKKIVRAAMIKNLGYYITLQSPIEEFDGLVLGRIALNPDFTERKLRVESCI